MNQYETIFISTPELTEDENKEVASKFRNLLTDNQAEIVNQEDWGLKKLAYPIDKKRNGFYTLYEYKAPGTVISTLETEFKRDERIIRFLTVKLDKFAIEYGERRRNKLSNQSLQTEEA